MKRSSIYFIAIICSLSTLLAQVPSPTLSIDMRLKLNAYQANYARPDHASTQIEPEQNAKSNSLTEANSPILSSVFYRLSSSKNIFSSLCQNNNRLSYCTRLNTVLFVQRKTSTYTASPFNNDGAIVAYIGKNNGASLSNWDSTCVWSKNTEFGYNPQAVLYNPPMNTNYIYSHVVATGPVKTGTTISGSFYASKSVSSTPANSPGSDQQFFANTGTFNTTTSPLMTKHDLPNFGITSTDAGVFSLGMLYNDVNAANDAAKGLRGVNISRGVFTSGAFVWTSDSLIPWTEIKTDGTKQMWNEAMMTWNPTGTVGYVVFIGVRQGAATSSNNRGWQPIIYKSTNGGTTWNLQNGINFNTPQYQQILNSLSPVQNNTAVTVPFFNPLEGIDITIDKDDKLHLVTTVLGTAKTHVDSLTYVNQYTINGEKYGWLYQPQRYPYIIDFIGDGSNFNFKIIDSVGSECAGTNSLLPGYNFNEWADTDSTKSVSSGMRIQVSRDYCGGFITYSWAESDSAIITNKWNQFPNIFTRAYRACDGSVSTDKYNISNPPSGALSAVRDHAYFHFLSPEMKAGTTSANSFTVNMPITVHNNATTSANSTVNNYFALTQLHFSFQSSPCMFPYYNYCNLVGINEKDNKVINFNLLPNPTNNKTEVSLTLNQANELTVEVYNAIGAFISSNKTQGLSGENKVPLDLKNFVPGVYFVKVKSNGMESTKKLIIQ